MKTILLGNRDSRPLGASEQSPFEKYGGDTTAIAVICGDTPIALDTGSGFWKWPFTLKTLFGENAPCEMNVFFSHYHADHTMGLPQSPLLFSPANTMNFHGPCFAPGLKNVFNAQANQPVNPNLTQAYKAQMNFVDLPLQGDVTVNGDAKVSWMSVPHGSEQSFGYRVDHDGQSLCVISDTHHKLDDSGKPIVDPAIVSFIKGADALIYDSHFSDAEFEKNPAFCAIMGHSTGEHGARLAAAAGVQLFIKHHHDPNKTDVVLDAETKALKAYGKARGVEVIAAQPSLCLDFSLPRASRMKYIEKQSTPKARYAAIAGKLVI